MQMETDPLSLAHGLQAERPARTAQEHSRHLLQALAVSLLGHSSVVPESKCSGPMGLGILGLPGLRKATYLYHIFWHLPPVVNHIHISAAQLRMDKVK